MNPLDIFKRGLEFLVESGQMELIAQGHNVTGRGLKSITYEITNADIRSFEANILANDYLVIQNYGVKANRIPFGGSSGNGSTSQYIEGLFDWAEKVRPSLTVRERKSFVFAVANKHKKEGMPTRGSFSYSSNGRRKSWIEFGMSNKVAQLERKIGVAEFLRHKIETDALKAAA